MSYQSEQVSLEYLPEAEVEQVEVYLPKRLEGRNQARVAAPVAASLVLVAHSNC